MSYSILTNIASLQAQNYLRTTSDFQQKTINRVTSGLRIVSAGDDAAGLAIANGMRSDQAVLSQGVRNANDGLSTLQTIDGGINDIANLLDRARTLATQSASGTFTGDRNVLNSEFQSVLTEIDRQAQAIGLDTGGQFAKSLSVFIGGGKANGGQTAIENGAVNVNLSNSTVDAKSLGLKGAQTVGTAGTDIGKGSQYTSVAAIVGDGANTTASNGRTDFYFAGPGFSDAGKVKVSVNVQNVSDTASLVTAINSAIGSAGMGGTQAATAFKNAGIVASVVTDQNGKQQLAFTSSTTAFQAEAGDRMANALLGNFAGANSPDGASVNTTTVTGNGNVTLANTASGAETVKVRFQGGGLSGPQDVTLTVANGESVQTLYNDLSSQVTNNSALQAAGITLNTITTGNPLVFANSRGEKFDVQASGDTQNLLGLGSFLQDAQGNVDYSTLTAASNYVNTAQTAAGTSQLQFSINGADSSSNQVNVDLGAGNATFATAQTQALGATTALSAANNTVRIAVDGTVYSGNLSVSGSPATSATLATGGVALDTGITIHGETSGTKSGSNLGAGVDTTGKTELWIKVDGGPTQKFSLTGAVGQDAAAVVAQLGGLVGATAGVVGGAVKISSTSTGANSTVQILNAGGTSADAVLGFNNVVSNDGAAGNNKMTIAVDGAAPATITLTNATYTADAAGATALAGDINTKFGSAIATLDGSNHLVLASTTTGANSYIALGTPAADSAYATLGVANGAAHGVAFGGDVARDQIAADLTTILTGSNATVTVGTDNKIHIQAASAGAAHSIQILAGTANTPLAMTATAGDNRTSADLLNALNQAFSSNTNQQLQKAGLVASMSGIQVKITSNNGTMFRVDAMGAQNAATMLGTANVATGGNFNLTGANVLSINGASVTLNNGNMTAAAIQGAIAGTTGTGVTASVVTSGGRDYLKLVSTATGSAAAITIAGSAAMVLGLASSASGSQADIGYGAGGVSFTGNAVTASSAATVDAGGTSQTAVIGFNPLLYGNDAQTITVAANDSSGTQQSLSILLQNSATTRNARTLDEAIDTINNQLQQSNNATLQNIVAVKDNDAGVEKIKFVSSLNSFSVSVGSNANSTGLGSQGTTLASGLAAGGATADVSTEDSAKAAVSAIADAVSALGTAQAVVGKGENQFSYAINLAQAQVTNEAAAESRIRDADLASEAANLTKAQILQQAGLAALAQANSAPQAVLALLRA